MVLRRERIYHKRDRLRQLRAFCHAGRFESITRAADHLGITQPAVSLHVRELELELEAVLFDRSGRRVALTSAGRLLYQLAMPLVEGVDRLPENFADQPDNPMSGEIHLAAGPSAVGFVLPRYAKPFRDENPEVRLRVTRTLVPRGLTLLSSCEVDFLVGAMEPVEDAFSYHPVLSYDLVLITPEDHPLAGRELVDIGEAARYPAVVPPPGTYNQPNGESIAHRFATEARVAVQTNGWGVIKQYVQDGLGISVVPSLCLTDEDRVRAIPIEGNTRGRSYGIFTCRATPVSPLARRFIRMMAPDFPEPSGASPAS
ncbi:MAG: LysR family transcriptional regulator [Immundisolibacterales bacterium]|nr:LysR family transcriptional regulator [Immundisolibacterales bacterium]